MSRQDGSHKEVPDIDVAMSYPIPVPPSATDLEATQYHIYTDHPTETLGSVFGLEVVQHVVDKTLELIEVNPSGRYPVSKVWHREPMGDGRELDLHEVLNKYIRKCHEYYDKWQAELRKNGANSGGGKKKKKK